MIESSILTDYLSNRRIRFRIEGFNAVAEEVFNAPRTRISVTCFHRFSSCAEGDGMKKKELDTLKKLLEEEKKRLALLTKIRERMCAIGRCPMDFCVALGGQPVPLRGRLSLRYA